MLIQGRGFITESGFCRLVPRGNLPWAVKGAASQQADPAAGRQRAPAQQCVRAGGVSSRDDLRLLRSTHGSAPACDLPTRLTSSRLPQFRALLCSALSHAALHGQPWRHAYLRPGQHRAAGADCCRGVLLKRGSQHSPSEVSF